jgi:hypothetical protein
MNETLAISLVLAAGILAADALMRKLIDKFNKFR